MVTSYSSGRSNVDLRQVSTAVADDKTRAQLRTRFGKLWPAIEARVASIDDPAQLDKFFERVAAAKPV